MIQTAHNLRLALLVLAIAAGFLLEAKASEGRAIAGDPDHLEASEAL
jgi:hypothetical protein